MENKECTWDPKKHNGQPCPTHTGGGFDDDYESDFGDDNKWESNKQNNVNNEADFYAKQNAQANVKEEAPKQEKRTKVAGIKERTENSANLMKDYLNDFYLDDEDAKLSDSEKANKLLDEFQNDYYDGRSNYQQAFGQFLMDYGVSPIYYDDIYDDLVKIGYVDDPKYKNNTDRLQQAYSFNMMKGIEKLANRKIYEKRRK